MTKPYTEATRAWLQAYRERNSYTLHDLARQLATNVTQVSKYLAAKPEGDVARLEGTVDDVRANEARRREAKHEYFETPVSRAVAGVFETIRETNDVGLLFGAAGVGKTCGVALYLAANPSALSVTVTEWAKGARAMERLLMGAVSARGWRGNVTRADFLVAKLSRSNRLIIVDNAHELSIGGIKWLFHFHDATDCPVALVGNPEVLDLIRPSDQRFSRIGLKRELKLKGGQARAVAAQLTTSLWPDAAEEVAGLTEAIAEQHGHFRALRKELLLARKIHGASKDTSYADAVKAAHTQLVRNYALQD